MKNERIMVFASLLTICLFLTVTSTQAIDALQQAEQIPVYLVIHVRDYNTDIAVTNLSITVNVNTDFGYVQFSNRTSETGDMQTTLGSIANNTVLQTMTLEYIDLSENYSLIKVKNTFVDELTLYYGFYSTYGANHTSYYFSTVLSNRILADRQYIEGTIWILKGKLVGILDADPITGTHQQLITTPAILTGISSDESTFERLYFFPIGYEVTIYHETQTWQNIETEK